MLDEKRTEIVTQKQKKAEELLAKANKIAQLREKVERESAAK